MDISSKIKGYFTRFYSYFKRNKSNKSNILKDFNIFTFYRIICQKVEILFQNVKSIIEKVDKSVGTVIHFGNNIMSQSVQVLSQSFEETLTLPRKAMTLGISDATRNCIFQWVLYWSSLEIVSLKTLIIGIDLLFWMFTPLFSYTLFQIIFVWNIIRHVYARLPKNYMYHTFNGKNFYYVEEIE